MKAIVQYKYGGPDKLNLEEVDKPTIKENEVLIEVFAANIASGDMRINTLDMPSFFKPIFKLMFGFKGPRNIIRGTSGAGSIVEVGSKVTKYNVGDRVNYISSMSEFRT